MTKTELSELLGVSLNSIDTNFPKVCASQLEKGILITKEGIGKNANFFVENVEPKKVDKSYFSSAKPKNQTSLENEEWITTYCSDNYEVSNLGRIRNKKNYNILQGTNKDGYIRVYIDKAYYLAHRIVLQSWKPNDNYNDMTVDHINGIRDDNRLENLQWATSEENTLWLLRNRKDITKETTRLINKYGYEKTLAILRSID